MCSLAHGLNDLMHQFSSEWDYCAGHMASKSLKKHTSHNHLTAISSMVFGSTYYRHDRIWNTLNMYVGFLLGLWWGRKHQKGSVPLKSNYAAFQQTASSE